MYLAADSFGWPDAVAVIGFSLGFAVLVVGSLIAYVELRKAKIAAAQEDNLRQLVGRYEQLAENTLDAQQRAAADIAELRSRTASVEQILRTVE